MASTNNENGNLTAKNSSSSNSLDQFPTGDDSAITKLFHKSPLNALKKVVRPKGYLPTSRRVNELKHDNAQKLTGLISTGNGKMEEIDQSFASDFDESNRWHKQNKIDQSFSSDFDESNRWQKVRGV